MTEFLLNDDNNTKAAATRTRQANEWWESGRVGEWENRRMEEINHVNKDFLFIPRAIIRRFEFFRVWKKKNTTTVCLVFSWREGGA
jgi:hypothetical protein